MNLAARAMTGLLLGLVCVADVALVMATNDHPIAGFRKSAASSPGAPARWQPAAPPAATQSPAAGGEQLAIRSEAPMLAPTAAPAKAKVKKTRSRAARPRAHPHAPVELAQEKTPTVSGAVAAATDAVDAVEPSAPTPAPPTPPTTVTQKQPDQPANVVTASLDISRPSALGASEAVSPADAGRAPDATPTAASDAAVPPPSPPPSASPVAKEDRATAAIDPPKAPDNEGTQAGASPASVDEHLAHGSQLMRQGKSKEAIADFERATELDPTSAGARAGLAVAEAWSDEGAAAAVDLDKAMALNPREPLIYDGRAVLAQKSGRAAEAIADYGQALALNPSDEFARAQQSGLQASLEGPASSLANTDPRRATVPDP
jgi:hypothetical protein